MSERRSGKYIAMFSVHGLVRSRDIELGRDADTGGQILYVIEQAKALAAHPRVEQVDLFTRSVNGANIDEDYSRPFEEFARGARIVRIECGPKRYLHKERLWPHLDAFVDQTVAYFRKVGRLPDVTHGHYADGGYVAARVSTLLGIPMIFTGHSLGRVKRERLLAKGGSAERLDHQYNFPSRIEAEEQALTTASMVIASTAQEVEDQYLSYDQYKPRTMKVIPPGVDLDRFSPPESGNPPMRMREEMRRFLVDPDKPPIFVMARPDPRKNFPAVIQAYGESPELRRLANLVLIAGNREDPAELKKAPRRVYIEMAALVDRYDLYGSVAYPKRHQSKDVPELYRWAAARRGVFVNPALTEPFGLTLIEAAASGLPIVATDDGGPRDIIKTCENGELVNALDTKAMGRAILSVLSDAETWDGYSRNGIKFSRRHYSWAGHVETYLENLRSVLKKEGPVPDILIGERGRLARVDRMLVSDIDNTLTGDEAALARLREHLHEHQSYLGFGVATGRSLASAREALEELNLPDPDAWISSEGTEIHYGRDCVRDRSWRKHIDYHWKPEAIRSVLDRLGGLSPRAESLQGEFKLSYRIEDGGPNFRKILGAMRREGLRVRVILSRGELIDLLPIRASTGLAIRFIGLKWGLPPERLLVAGNSGADEEMLRGDTLGVVVGNYSEELENLRNAERVYFADGRFAEGILEGINHYNFLGTIRIPDEGVDDHITEAGVGN